MHACTHIVTTTVPDGVVCMHGAAWLGASCCWRTDWRSGIRLGITFGAYLCVRIGNVSGCPVVLSGCFVRLLCPNWGFRRPQSMHQPIHQPAHHAGGHPQHALGQGRSMYGHGPGPGRSACSVLCRVLWLYAVDVRGRRGVYCHRVLLRCVCCVPCAVCCGCARSACSAIAVPLQCHCSAIAVPLQCHCNAIHNCVGRLGGCVVLGLLRGFAVCRPRR